MHLLSTAPHPSELLSILDFAPPDGRRRFMAAGSDHHEFRLIPMTPHDGWPVAICEASVGRPFPSYATRRDWRASLRSLHGVGILLFTDAAHSSFVWTWRERYPTGHVRYVEFDSRTRMEALRAAMSRLHDFDGVIDGPTEIDSDTEKLLEPIFRGAPPGRDGGDDWLTIALDTISACDDPDRLRTIWRRLRGIAVIHPAAEDGSRLVRAAETLEMVFTGVIERMRGFIADSTMLGGRRRPEHLRDMRSLADAAEDRLWGRDTRRYVRRLIVQQNLFAVVRTRAAGRTVARDLLCYAGVDQDALPSLDCNVWREPGTSSIHAPGGSGRLHAAVGGTLVHSISEGGSPIGDCSTAEQLTESLELHRRAWEMVRRVRLAGGHFGDLRLAVSQLERRRSLLRRQLRALEADSAGSSLEDEMRFCRSPGERGLSMIVG